MPTTVSQLGGLQDILFASIVVVTVCIHVIEVFLILTGNVPSTDGRAVGLC